MEKIALCQRNRRLCYLTIKCLAFFFCSPHFLRLSLFFCCECLSASKLMSVIQCTMIYSCM